MAGSGRRRVLQGRPQALAGVVSGTVGSRPRGDAADPMPRRTSGPVRCMDNLVLGRYPATPRVGPVTQGLIRASPGHCW